MNKMKKELEKYFDRNIPFVIYRKPNSKRVMMIIQNDNSVNYVNDYTESGFVFAPFDNERKSILLPYNIYTKK
jgi:isochorismate synthase